MSVDRHQTGETDAPRDGREPEPGPSVDHHPMAVIASKPKREPCRCPAYSWPHRLGGGRCRWPDPPETPHPTPAGTNRRTGLRRRGLRKWIIQHYRLHPIRDRETIARLLPVLYDALSRGRWLTLDEAKLLASRSR